MELGLQPAAWRELFGAVATAAAALLGLLFVAMSLHPQDVESSPTLRLRARVNLQALAALLTFSVAVLLPGQNNVLIGAELLVITLVYLILVAGGAWRTSRELRGVRGGMWWRRLLSQNLLVLLQVAAGVSLIVGHGPGLYFMAPVLLTVMPIVTFNCWNVIFAPELRRH